MRWRLENSLNGRVDPASSDLGTRRDVLVESDLYVVRPVHDHRLVSGHDDSVLSARLWGRDCARQSPGAEIDARRLSGEHDARADFELLELLERKLLLA